MRISKAHLLRRTARLKAVAALRLEESNARAEHWQGMAEHYQQKFEDLRDRKMEADAWKVLCRLTVSGSQTVGKELPNYLL